MASSSLNANTKSIDNLCDSSQQPLERIRGGAGAVEKTASGRVDNAVVIAAEVETFETDAEDEELTGQKFAEIEDEVPSEKRIIKRIEQILRLSKILFLLGLWILMTYFLMTTFDNKVATDLVSVPPGVAVDCILDDLPNNDLAGIRLYGPFIPQINDSMYHEPLIFDPVFERTITKDTAPQWLLNVMVQVPITQMTADGRKTLQKNISKIWQVELADPSNFDETTQINRDFIFKLDGYDSRDKSLKDAKINLLFSTNDAVKSTLAFEVFYDLTPVPELWGIIVSLLILTGFYLILLTDRVDRILVSMIGSTIAVSVMASNDSRPSMEVLMSWVEPNMLLMVFGITIIMGFFVQTGVFDWIAVYSYQIFNGHIWPPINTLCGITFLLCCIFDKMTVVLMIAPVVIRLCEVMQVHPVPVFTCIICFSNVGSIWTLTAAEENALIITHKYLSENGVSHVEFILHMLPGVLLICIQTYLQLRLNFRGIRNIQFHESPEVMKMQRLLKTLKRTADTMGTFSKDEKTVKQSLLTQMRRLRVKLRRIAKVDKPREDYASTLAALKARYPLRNKALLLKCCIALIWIMLLFLFSTMTNLQQLSVGWTALLGALLLLILADMEDMEAVLLRVEWGTCMFFATFFILIQGIIRLGLTNAIAEWTVQAVMYFSPERRFAAAILILLWISGISSIFICSVPIANTMIHVSVILVTNAESAIPLHPLVWALTFGTCLGNNGTLISGFSNVVCAGIVEHHGYKFRFYQFFKVCFPITIGGLMVASIYMILCHVVGSWH